MKKKTLILAVAACLLTFAGGYRLAYLTSTEAPAQRPLAKGAPINQAPPSTDPRASTAPQQPRTGPGGAALRPTPTGLDPAKLAASVPPPHSRDGFLSLGFDQLSQYPYVLNNDGTIGNLPNGKLSEIPEDIKKYDGKKVALSGFAIPLSYEENKPTMFVLAKNQMLCCYGQAPKANEWAIVTMKKPVELALDKPLAIAGTLRVGEVIEDGVVLCLYRLEGDDVFPTER